MITRYPTIPTILIKIKAERINDRCTPSLNVRFRHADAYNPNVNFFAWIFMLTAVNDSAASHWMILCFLDIFWFLSVVQIFVEFFRLSKICSVELHFIDLKEWSPKFVRFRVKNEGFSKSELTDLKRMKILLWRDETDSAAKGLRLRGDFFLSS